MTAKTFCSIRHQNGSSSWAWFPPGWLCPRLLRPRIPGTVWWEWKWCKFHSTIKLTTSQPTWHISHLNPTDAFSLAQRDGAFQARWWLGVIAKLPMGEREGTLPLSSLSITATLTNYGLFQAHECRRDQIALFWEGFPPPCAMLRYASAFLLGS